MTQKKAGGPARPPTNTRADNRAPHTRKDSTQINALATALEWLALGVALVPLQPHTKKLIGGFGPYRKHITREGEAREWFGKRQCNLGVLCAGPLVCVDFDRLQSFSAWQQFAPGIFTRIELTRRGAHVFLFARHLPTTATQIDFFKTEIKARGAVVTVAPSVVNGAHYRIADHSQILRVESLAELFPLLSPPLSVIAQGHKAEEEFWARIFSERGIPDPAPAPSPQMPIPAVATATSPIAKLKAALSVLDIARELVPDLHSSDGGKGRWYAGLCPFHPDRNPSFWVDATRNLWGCHSTNCPQQGGHDVLNLAALRRDETMPKMASNFLSDK